MLILTSSNRIVITSSFASIVSANGHPKVYDESHWNPVTFEEAVDSDQPPLVYRASKTLAEKAAWKFVEEEKPNFDIATICPPMVFGPIVHYLNSLDAINTSNQRVVDMIQGKMKDELAPSGTVLWVDVRDVALAHVLALEKPKAGGNRFFLVAGHFDNKSIAEIIAKNFPEVKDKLPSKLESDLPKDVYGFDNSKSKKELGIEYQPFEKTITDTARSIIDVGAKTA